MALHVAGLWRYPVKTLARRAVIDGRARAGGHSWRSHRLGGRPGGRPYCATAIQTPRIAGAPRIGWGSTHQWPSLEHAPEALALVKRAAGEDAWLEASDGLERFDVLPLLVATDGAVAAFGRDIRRLRPNILIGGVEGLDETTWPGAELWIGDAIVRLDSLRARCPMTTVDPDTLDRDPEVLRDIGRRFRGRLALNAEVVHAGTISVGDPVRVIRRQIVSGVRGQDDYRSRALRRRLRLSLSTSWSFTQSGPSGLYSVPSARIGWRADPDLRSPQSQHPTARVGRSGIRVSPLRGWRTAARIPEACAQRAAGTRHCAGAHDPQPAGFHAAVRAPAPEHAESHVEQCAGHVVSRRLHRRDSVPRLHAAEARRAREFLDCQPDYVAAVRRGSRARMAAAIQPCRSSPVSPD